MNALIPGLIVLGILILLVRSINKNLYLLFGGMSPKDKMESILKKGGNFTSIRKSAEQNGYIINIPIHDVKTIQLADPTSIYGSSCVNIHECDGNDYYIPAHELDGPTRYRDGMVIAYKVSETK